MLVKALPAGPTISCKAACQIASHTAWRLAWPGAAGETSNVVDGSIFDSGRGRDGNARPGMTRTRLRTSKSSIRTCSFFQDRLSTTGNIVRISQFRRICKCYRFFDKIECSLILFSSRQINTIIGETYIAADERFTNGDASGCKPNHASADKIKIFAERGSVTIKLDINAIINIATIDCKRPNFVNRFQKIAIKIATGKPYCTTVATIVSVTRLILF